MMTDAVRFNGDGPIHEGLLDAAVTRGHRAA